MRSHNPILRLIASLPSFVGSYATKFNSCLLCNGNFDFTDDNTTIETAVEAEARINKWKLLQKFYIRTLLPEAHIKATDLLNISSQTGQSNDGSSQTSICFCAKCFEEIETLFSEYKELVKLERKFNGERKKIVDVAVKKYIVRGCPLNQKLELDVLNYYSRALGYDELETLPISTPTLPPHSNINNYTTKIEFKEATIQAQVVQEDFDLSLIKTEDDIEDGEDEAGEFIIIPDSLKKRNVSFNPVVRLRKLERIDLKLGPNVEINQENNLFRDFKESYNSSFTENDQDFDHVEPRDIPYADFEDSLNFNSKDEDNEGFKWSNSDTDVSSMHENVDTDTDYQLDPGYYDSPPQLESAPVYKETIAQQWSSNKLSNIVNKGNGSSDLAATIAIVRKKYTKRSKLSENNQDLKEKGNEGVMVRKKYTKRSKLPENDEESKKGGNNEGVTVRRKYTKRSKLSETNEEAKEGGNNEGLIVRRKYTKRSKLSETNEEAKEGGNNEGLIVRRKYTKRSKLPETETNEEVKDGENKEEVVVRRKYTKRKGETNTPKGPKQPRISIPKPPKVIEVIDPDFPIIKKKRNRYPRPKIECEFCKKQIPAGYIKYHRRVHTKEKPHLCPFCSKGFYKKSNLNKHVMTHTKDKAYLCDECPNVYTDKNTLNTHKAYKHGVFNGKGVVECELCWRKFLRRNEFRAHFRRVHNPENYIILNGHLPFHCQPCSKEFNLVEEYKSHRETEEHKVAVLDFKEKHPELLGTPGSLTCLYSKKTTKTLTSNQNGERVNVAGVCEVKCKICNSTFRNRNSMLQHIRRCHGSKDHICEICGKCFSDRGNCAKHIRSHNAGISFQCSECGAGFKHQISLKYHMSHHTGEGMFQCQYCDETFGNSLKKKKHLVETHPVEHLKGDTFVCREVCFKNFATEGELKVHMESHEHLRCSFCRRYFQTTKKVQNHLVTHTKERPYSCEICNRTFAQETNLREHTFRHTGYRPFKCEKCDIGFLRNKEYRVHMELEHGEIIIFGREAKIKAARQKKMLPDGNLNGSQNPRETSISSQIGGQIPSPVLFSILSSTSSQIETEMTAAPELFSVVPSTSSQLETQIISPDPAPQQASFPTIDISAFQYTDMPLLHLHEN